MTHKSFNQRDTVYIHHLSNKILELEEPFTYNGVRYAYLMKLIQLYSKWIFKKVLTNVLVYFSKIIAPKQTFYTKKKGALVNTKGLTFFKRKSMQYLIFNFIVNILATPTNAPVSCGGNFSSVSAGVILSPDYPNNYPNLANCTWTLQLDSPQTIVVRFALPTTVEDDKTCSFDSFQVTQP